MWTATYQTPNTRIADVEINVFCNVSLITLEYVHYAWFVFKKYSMRCPKG